MKFKSILSMTIMILSLVGIFSLNAGMNSLGLIWLLILIVSFKNLTNHFISLLMILEMFSLSSLLVSMSILVSSGSLSLMFILMSLSVGEGVLGLALLVKFVRSTSLDQVENTVL